MKMRTSALALVLLALPIAATASCKSRFDTGASRFYQAQETYNRALRLVKSGKITCATKGRVFDLTRLATKQATQSHSAFYSATKACRGRSREAAGRSYEKAYNLRLQGYALEDEIKGQCP